MKKYEPSQSFRETRPSRLLSARSATPAPSRDRVLDDLHRALYGSLHPAGAIEEREEPAKEDEEATGGWLERHAVTLGAIAVVGGAAFWWWKKQQKTEPLRIAADAAPPASPVAATTTERPAPTETIAPPAPESPTPTPPTPLRAVS
jgi:hypothetical protein